MRTHADQSVRMRSPAFRLHEPRPATAPAWTTYAGEARRMIAAVRAMGLLESRCSTIALSCLG